MDLLVRYGEALAPSASWIPKRLRHGGRFDAVPARVQLEARRHGRRVPEFTWTSAEVVEIPKVSVYISHLQQGIDPEHAERQGIAAEIVTFPPQGRSLCGAGSPADAEHLRAYTVGNVPSLGEHCAWMESSAVIYINSVLGARTNAEAAKAPAARADRKIRTGAITSRK